MVRCMYHCSRADVLYALLNDVNHEDITFDLLVKVMNESVADYDLKLKKETVKDLQGPGKIRKNSKDRTTGVKAVRNLPIL